MLTKSRINIFSEKGAAWEEENQKGEERVTRADTIKAHHVATSYTLKKMKLMTSYNIH